MNALAAEMLAGTAPDTPEVEALIERHRLHIDRWFYPCSPEVHTGLAGLYENDARYAANIDRYRDGLTAYLVSAIRHRTPIG